MNEQTVFGLAEPFASRVVHLARGVFGAGHRDGGAGRGRRLLRGWLIRRLIPLPPCYIRTGRRLLSPIKAPPRLPSGQQIDGLISSLNFASALILSFDLNADKKESNTRVKGSKCKTSEKPLTLCPSVLGVFCSSKSDSQRPLHHAVGGAGRLTETSIGLNDLIVDVIEDQIGINVVEIRVVEKVVRLPAELDEPSRPRGCS